jgi:protease IV
MWVRRSVWAFWVGILLLVLAAPARAQVGPFARTTGSVMTPGVSIAAPDGAYATELNPSALGFMRSWELAYVHMDPGGGERFAHGGDGVFFGTPLLFGLAAGGHLARVRPTGDTGLADRGAGSVALALAPGPSFAVGTAMRLLRSDDFFGRHVGWDVSVSARPSSYLALSLVAHDLNALARVTPAGLDLPATFVLAAAARPFGDDALTLEAAGAMDSMGVVGARGLVAVAVPHVGQLRAVLEADDLRGARDLRVLAGLDVRWGALGVGGGVLMGDGFGDGPGWYLSARVGGARQPGLPMRQWVLDLEVRGEVDSRRILELTRLLDASLHDASVQGLFLRLRDTDLPLAYAQELRWLIARLEEAGKPVLCQLETASGAEYYACAGASRVLIDPAGSLRLVGPSVDVVFLGDLLERVGIHADFVRIGPYKSAPEQLTRSGSSEPAREQRDALLDDVYMRLVADLAGDLEVEAGDVRSAIDGGPYAAVEAVAAKLVDGAGDDLVPRALVRDTFGAGYAARASFPTGTPRHWGRRGRVGVVVVDGTMVDGDNVDVPIVDVHLTGARTVVKAINSMVADPAVAAIVLRVDSGGGSAVGADKIWRAVRRAARKKPVIASMGAAAASGGYYIASAATEIWADPSTVTGSIGIFFGKVDVSGLAERAGVNVEQFSRGERAGAQSIWRPYTPEQREVLSDKIRIWYELFLQRVAEGRGMEPSAVDALGQGRVWSGDAAVRVGLVDHLGGFGAALARARGLGGLPEDAPFDVAPFRPRTLLEYAVGRALDAQGRATVVVPAALRHALSASAVFGTVDGMAPLALAPFTVRVQ